MFKISGNSPFRYLSKINASQNVQSRMKNFVVLSFIIKESGYSLSGHRKRMVK